jgi:hypothetical protein
LNRQTQTAESEIGQKHRATFPKRTDEEKSKRTRFNLGPLRKYFSVEADQGPV